MYTNHSLRATCVTILDNAGFASRDIMAVSGHKSESSLKHYVKTSDAKKKHMSAEIARQMNQQPEDQQGPSTSVSVDLEDKPQSTTDPKPAVPLQTIVLNSAQVQEILKEGATTLSSITSNQMSFSSSRETVQNFHFHGAVVFYNNTK